MRRYAVILTAALALAPLGAWGADLVVWWDEGWYAEEAEAAGEVVEAFEEGTGKQVELVLQPEQEHASAIIAALEAGRPPDVAFGIGLTLHVGEWAREDRLVDLSDAVGAFATRTPSTVRLCSTRRPGRRPCTHFQWVVRPTTSTFGRAS